MARDLTKLLTFAFFVVAMSNAPGARASLCSGLFLGAEKGQGRLGLIESLLVKDLQSRMETGEMLTPVEIESMKSHHLKVTNRLRDHMTQLDFELTLAFLKFKWATLKDDWRFSGVPEKQTWFWNGQLRVEHLSWSGFAQFLSMDRNDIQFRTEADLEFLKHLANTAEELSQGLVSGRVPFHKAYGAAMESWELRQLQNLEPEVGIQIDSLKRESHDERNLRISRLLSGFEAHLIGRDFLSFGPAVTDLLIKSENFLRGLRTQLAWYPSPLNDLIVTKYFDLFQRTKIPPEALSESFVDHKQDYSHPRVFLQSSFEFGNIASLLKFLKDNSYEAPMRLHLLRILDRATELLDQHDENLRSQKLDPAAAENKLEFQKLFYRARYPLDRAVHAANPAPPEYRLSLNIFSVKSQIVDSDVVGLRVHRDPYLVETQILWCPIRNGLYASYLGGARLQESTGELPPVFRRLKKHIKTFFDEIYRKEEVISEDRISRYEEGELNIPIGRTTYFVFSDPVNGNMKAMFRIFDGSPLYWQPDSGALHSVGSEKTFIERDFPHLKLEERQIGVAVYELGRLGATKDVRDGARPLFSRVAEYLRNTGKTGVLYFDALPGATRLYQDRYGATVKYTPEQLGLGKDEPQISIMRMTTDQFIETHFNPEYRQPQLRQ